VIHAHLQLQTHSTGKSSSSWKEPSEASYYIILITATRASSNCKGVFTKSRWSQVAASDESDKTQPVIKLT